MTTARLLVGDVLAGLRTLDAGTVRTCVTSPPYFGLRDYGCKGQIGLERTPAEYVARLVDVFRQVRRVLADDGTVWLNLGDSYATGAGKVGACPGGVNQGRMWAGPETQPNRLPLPGLKPKDLIGIPWRVAFALQADGWFLRSDIIWHKPNPMPESVRDRPTKSHEYVFLLAKSERYFYDADAVREPFTVGDPRPMGNRNAAAHNRRVLTGNMARGAKLSSLNPLGRNRRDVWTVTPRPYHGAHFAVMPEPLVEPCILAGSAAGDLVLDPFAGSGTVGAVAARLGRSFVGCELNSEYAKLAAARVPGLARVRSAALRAAA